MNMFAKVFGTRSQREVRRIMRFWLRRLKSAPGDAEIK